MLVYELIFVKGFAIFLLKKEIKVNYLRLKAKKSVSKNHERNQIIRLLI